LASVGLYCRESCHIEATDGEHDRIDPIRLMMWAATCINPARQPPYFQLYL